MILKDQKLAFLRRRLIQSLKYIKTYMEDVQVKFHPDEIEVNVRPSLPFKLMKQMNAEAAVEFGNLKSAKSAPAALKEALEMSASLSAGLAKTYALDWNLKSQITGSSSLEKMTFIKPLGVEVENLFFYSGFDGILDFAKVEGLDTSYGMTSDFYAKTEFITMPRMYPNIGLDISITPDVQMTLMKPMKTDAFEVAMAIDDQFKVALQHIRPVAQWGINLFGDLQTKVSKIVLPALISDYEGTIETSFVPGLYRRTTLEALGNTLMADLDDMPVDVGYVLVTYTDDDYPWEV